MRRTWKAKWFIKPKGDRKELHITHCRPFLLERAATAGDEIIFTKRDHEDAYDVEIKTNDEEVGFEKRFGDLVSDIERGRVRDGQRFVRDSNTRREIELRAMRVASEYYAGLGFEVEDVSARESYVLLCKKGGEYLAVEVKGTTASGCKIFLTRNEVLHAESDASRVALVVVSGIFIDADEEGEIVARGGRWLSIDHGRLLGRGSIRSNTSINYCPLPDFGNER